MKVPRTIGSSSRVLWCVSLIAVGCATAGPGAGTSGVNPAPTTPIAERVEWVPDATIGFTVITDSLPGDRALETLVAPFRARMGEEIRQVIGEALVPLAEAAPEGTLGNFASDAMLWTATRETSAPIHMAMTNNGGLRIPISPGPITVGLMFELMPFENMLSVLTLTGRQVQAFADELARRRGQPIAGFSFRIETVGEDRVAREVKVDGVLLDLSKEYRLVTNDYLANGGDGFETLGSPVEREDLPILVRDALIEYVRAMGTISYAIEGRITGGIGR